MLRGVGMAGKKRGNSSRQPGAQPHHHQPTVDGAHGVDEDAMTVSRFVWLCSGFAN